ncbi:hypothetical protein RM555_03125 [Micromonospora sp. DSM 115977]|uniref:Polymorphic outer membrane protein repeat-containing protein n=1 Tax=Micromonospora reichwaldensis TaxID=3075516 RepID=A0ABU2WQ19_9ACTN|nr:hypothetical protein [Micromonospora sp. DSM 115977]MDT0527982.1 hypothetical protein [Micromonospora sp. DSM 115977]
MRVKSLAALLVLSVAGAGLPACGDSAADGDLPPAPTAAATPAGGAEASSPGAAPTARSGLGGPAASASPGPSTRAAALKAGNPDGGAAVPAEARAVDTSRPTRTIGSGTAASCTSAAVVKAVAAGGVITFDCGPRPVTIKMTATAKVRNANGPRVVLDGGGMVTLSGQGQRRILYMNTCDSAQGWTTSHCQNQDHPQLTVQNLTFADGNSTGERTEGGGGGAILVRGGRFKVVNSRFVRNRCDRTGPDLGGAAIRVLSQHENKPVYVVGSTFDGGVCANGGALSSIGVTWVVLNSVLRDNRAVGTGANPARPGTPGGGSGGAIYCDGNEFTVRIAGTVIEGNEANEGGGAVFFVSNDRTGTMRIENSTLRRNPSNGFETRGYPGIFFLGARNPTLTGSRLS